MARSVAATIEAANATLIAEGKLAVVEEFFTPDYVAHLTGRDIHGHAGVRRYLRMLRAAFPDVQVEVETLVQGRGRVAWQRTLRGTQRGEFAGFSASGRRVVWRDMLVSELRGGRIREEWAISELAERLLLARKR